MLEEVREGLGEGGTLRRLHESDLHRARSRVEAHSAIPVDIRDTDPDFAKTVIYQELLSFRPETGREIWQMPRREDGEKALAYALRLRVAIARIDLEREGAVLSSDLDSVVLVLTSIINRVQTLEIHKSLGIKEEAAAQLLTLDGDEPEPAIMQEIDRRMRSAHGRPKREQGETGLDFLNRLAELLAAQPEAISAMDAVNTARHLLAEAEFMQQG